ncbi:MAG: hypothetical protein IPG71_12325 [bacterium]|nr:hypothetical protein [bacterium]
MSSRKFKGGKTGANRAERGGSLLEMMISMTLGAVILVSLFSLYYVAAATAAKEESRARATSEGRLLAMRLAKDLRLMGLFATEDIDGDSNDIDTDVPDIDWANGASEPIESAESYELVFSSDIDNDSLTEIIGLWSNADGIQQDVWEWQRDSTKWGQRSSRVIGSNVDAVLFRYVDSEGNALPQEGAIPSGGFVLTPGQRMRVAAIEVTLIVRSEEESHQEYREMISLPDGRYWYDNFHREVYRFTVRGRNLNLNS